MEIQEGEEIGLSRNNKLLLDALTTHMERKMNSLIDVWWKEFKPSVLDRGKINQRRKESRHHQGVLGDEKTPKCYNQNSQGSQQGRRRGREEKVAPRSNFGVQRIQIPPFHGTNDIDVYLEWEKKIELVFEGKKFTEKNKVKIASTEFYDEALSWWDHLVTTRTLLGDEPIETWLHLKRLLRKRFVPSYYHHKLHPKPKDDSRGLKEPFGDKVLKSSNHHESYKIPREREHGREGISFPRENKPILTPMDSREPRVHRDQKPTSVPTPPHDKYQDPRTMEHNGLVDYFSKGCSKEPNGESMMSCDVSFTPAPKKDELPSCYIQACVPSYAMGDLLVREAHGADIMGHFGIAKTFTNKSKIPQHGLRILSPIPMHSWNEIFMNLIVGLPRDSSDSMVVDRTFSMKPCFAFHRTNASHIASLFVEEVARFLGLPMTLTLPTLSHALIRKDLGSREACLHNIEFVYISMHVIYKFSLFQNDYGVSPIPPLDLTSFLLSARGSLHRKRRVGVAKKVPKVARYNLEEIMRQYKRRTLRRIHDKADHLNNQGGRDLRTNRLQEEGDDMTRDNVMSCGAKGTHEVKNSNIDTKESLHTPKEPMSCLWTKQLRDVAKEASKDVPCKKLGPPPWLQSNLLEEAWEEG